MNNNDTSTLYYHEKHGKQIHTPNYAGSVYMHNYGWVIWHSLKDED